MSTKSIRIGMAIVMIGATFVFAFAGSAVAHKCRADTHEGCNGHRCPDDGEHHFHKTEHGLGGDHECESHPYNDEIVDTIQMQLSDPVPVGDLAAAETAENFQHD